MSLQEGWWKKKGKHKVNREKARYFILFADCLNWYHKPGGERSGTIPLNHLYIRMSPDKKELVIGDQTSSKEMNLHTDSHENQKRVKEWFDTITLAIDSIREKQKEAMNHIIPKLDIKPEVSPRSRAYSDPGRSHSPRINQSPRNKSPSPREETTITTKQYDPITGKETVTTKVTTRDGQPIDQHSAALQASHAKAQAEAQAKAEAKAKALAEAQALAKLEQEQIALATAKISEVSLNTQVAAAAAMQATAAAQQMAAEAVRQQALADAALERARLVSTGIPTQTIMQQQPNPYQQTVQLTPIIQTQQHNPYQTQYQQTILQPTGMYAQTVQYTQQPQVIYQPVIQTVPTYTQTVYTQPAYY